MSKKEQSLQNTTEQSLSIEMASMREEFAGAIDVRKDLITIPVIKVTNALSDAFKASVAKLGEFFCKASGENFGSTLNLIPLFITESASLLDKKTSKPLCKTINLKYNLKGEACHECPFGTYWNDWSKGAPDCKIAIDIICLVYRGVDHTYTNKDVMQIDFRKMAHKAGVALVNLCKYDKLGVPFGSRYTINSKADKKENYDFFTVDANSIKQATLTEQELAKVIPLARQLNDARKAGNIKVEDEGTSQHDDVPL